ncbi:MAG: hypothetical protein ABH870_08380 [bacterium]
MAKAINREDMQELLGVIKDILGPEQKQDLDWKKEMENPQVDGDPIDGEIDKEKRSVNYTARNASSINSYFREKEPKTTSSKSADIVNFLWIVIITFAIGFGCWSFFSSGTAGKVMDVMKQQGAKVGKATTGWAQK